MKPNRLLAVLLCLAFCGGAFAQAQEMDKELADLAEKLAAKVQSGSKKKITVLDFTDLDGGTSELGKYVAEQLTVSFVTGDRKFTVVDRANLKKILAEHKLTASGLVDPENAKKLGQFSGVDALILGTIVSMPPNIKLTAKIITTDTADIIGAGQCTFKSDTNVQQLLARDVSTPSETTTTEPAKAAPPVHKPIGDLQVLVESLKILPKTDVSYWRTRLTLIITNTSATQTYGVAMQQNCFEHFKLSNSNGEDFEALDVTGINTGFLDGGRFYGSMTDIPPRGSITIVANGQRLTTDKTVGLRPFRLQTELHWAIDENSRYPNVKTHNLIMDIK